MATSRLGGECWQNNMNDKSKQFSHPLHASYVLSALNESRKNPLLCDGFVVLEGKQISVQRNVLSAASEYFRALYTYHHQESGDQQNEKTRNLENTGVTIATFQQILDFIYTSSIRLNEDNIQSILQAADLFLMQELKQLCCEYLEGCISTHNVLGIRDFAHRFACPRVYHLATQYMDEYFCDIIYSEEFVELPLDKLRELLRRVSLRVQGELAIFEAVMNWVRHNLDSRKAHIRELIMDCVRLECVTDVDMHDMLGEELVRDLELGDWLVQQRAARTGLPPVVRGYTSMLVIVGGEGPSHLEPGIREVKSSVFCVDIGNCLMGPEVKVVKWLHMPSTRTPRSGHGVCIAGGQMYAIGGRDQSGQILSSGERYDPATNQWEEIAPMNDARVGFGLVSIEDKLYAIGASNDMSDPLTSVEEYDIYTNKWRRLPDMNLKRAWAAHAVVDKKIYVMGGGILGRLYEAVECFDLRSETWMSVASMKERRFDARAISYKSDVYVFGGLRRFECPSAMHTGTGMKFCGNEVYSTEHKQWTANNHPSIGMCSMNEASHIDSVVQLDDQLLVIGDLEVGGQYHFVRAYCPTINKWRGVIANATPTMRCAGACILKIPNATLQKIYEQQSHLR